MRNRMIMGYALTLAALVGTAVFAGQKAGAVVDRRVYSRLTEQVRQVDVGLARVLAEAMKEARQGNGRASVETQSRLLGLREKRDRVLSRLTIVSLRHGWPMPSQNPPAAAKPGPKPRREGVLEPAAVMIRARFAAESQRIAASVKLPVISVKDESAEGRAK